MSENIRKVKCKIPFRIRNKTHLAMKNIWRMLLYFLESVVLPFSIPTRQTTYHTYIVMLLRICRIFSFSSISMAWITFLERRICFFFPEAASSYPIRDCLFVWPPHSASLLQENKAHIVNFAYYFMYEITNRYLKSKTSELARMLIFIFARLWIQRERR